MLPLISQTPSLLEYSPKDRNEIVKYLQENPSLAAINLSEIRGKRDDLFPFLPETLTSLKLNRNEYEQFEGLDDAGLAYLT